jgi:methionine-rich copper-binding protein CopC
MMNMILTRRTLTVASMMLAAATLTRPVYGLIHAVLRSSVPTAGASVPVAPTALSLTFSEKIDLPMARVTILARGRDTIPTGTFTSENGATVLVPVARVLAPGSYTVKYRVAGSDGHPMGGSFTFTVAPKP